MPNILLIDPNVALARTYMQALQHAGHQVVHVVGAQEAIDAADKQVPNLVVLELQIAIHDGIEFLHEFRSYPEWQAIPVIVLTGITPAAIASSKNTLAGELGVVACLYKPQTSLQQLLSSVNEQLVRT